MKKKVLFLVLAMLMTSAFFCFPFRASADESITGSTVGVTTFYVVSKGGNAYIDLNSYKGRTLCTQYYAYIFTYGDQYEEDNHGFYKVMVNGPSNQSYEWTPSATKDYSENQVNDDSLRITFPSSGLYTITVDPIGPSNIQFAYWREDSLDRWIENATWSVAGIGNCEVTWSKPQSGTQVLSESSMTVELECYLSNSEGPFHTFVYEITADKWFDPPYFENYYQTVSDSQYAAYVPGGRETLKFYYIEVPTSAYLNVFCYDEYGNMIDMYNEVISESQYIYPRSFDDYEALSNCEYIYYSSGSCSPEEIYFYYRHKSSPQVSSDYDSSQYDFSVKSTKEPTVEVQSEYDMYVGQSEARADEFFRFTDTETLLQDIHTACFEYVKVPLEDLCREEDRNTVKAINQMRNAVLENKCPDELFNIEITKYLWGSCDYFYTTFNNQRVKAPGHFDSLTNYIILEIGRSMLELTPGIYIYVDDYNTYSYDDLADSYDYMIHYHYNDLMANGIP